MQNAYLPFRAQRFSLLFRLPEIAREAELRILDLGCGPGSLSFTALRHYPNARVMGVDTDPVLLALGRGVAPTQATKGDGVTFLKQDLRDPDWWADYASTFDMVVSATALHWLSSDDLPTVYARIFDVLKPGGWFLNVDHMACDDPVLQNRYRYLMQKWQQAQLEREGVDDWDAFWSGLTRAMASEGLPAQPQVDQWEGSDDGHSRRFHVDALAACGFKHIAVHWQYLGEALLGGVKPG
jgi:SAM-dependent methyltransferase